MAARCAGTTAADLLVMKRDCSLLFRGVMAGKLRRGLVRVSMQQVQMAEYC